MSFPHSMDDTTGFDATDEEMGLAPRDFANARLIAAAPDMLDALRQWQYAQREHDAVEMVNAQISRDAAIAKATGKA